MEEVAAYDVCVVGGGPAGAASALELARASRRVLLLDKSKAGDFKIGEGLPPAVMPLLRDLGIGKAFLAGRHLPSYGNLSAWGSPHLQSTDFIFDPNGHGWHVDRACFDALLRDHVGGAGAEVRQVTSLTRHRWDHEAGLWHLSLLGPEGKGEARCRWLVDASGRRCAVARQQGAKRRADDALTAVYSVFRQADGTPNPDQDSRTLIEAAPDGWWYTARLPANRRVVVYHTDNDLLPSGTLLAPQGFMTLLDSTEHIRGYVMPYGYTMLGVPRAAPALSAQLDRFVGEGWLATGDAAICFDPLSSQGIMTALYAGMSAARALDAHLSGDIQALDVYSASLAAIYKAYLNNRLFYYRYERRWPDRPFWRRRIDG